VKVYLLTKDEGGRSKPLTKNNQVQMYCKTWDAPVMLELTGGKDLVMPGEDAAIKLTIRKPMVSELGLLFSGSG
jgi:elongation factor Tu